MPKSISIPLLAAGVALAATVAFSSLGAGADPQPDKAAVDRARDTVKLLDDLNKGFVVNITDTYVKAQEKTPAATVLKKVFAHMEKNNHGTGRLIDVTGSPIREGNVAKSQFEKAAVNAIKDGNAYFDEVGTKDGKPVLRAATLVPAVMPACVTCHPHVKLNEPLGALVYEIPIK